MMQDSNQDSPRAIEKALSLRTVNRIGIVLILALVIPLIVIYESTWGKNPFAVMWDSVGGKMRFQTTAVLAFLGILAVSIVIHELLHGLGYRLGGVKTRDIKISIFWQALTPYAHCKAPMRIAAYRFAIGLPGFALGLLPVVIGFVLPNGWVMCFGIIMLAAAVGDGIILWLSRSVPAGALVQDHPSKAGFTILLP